MVLWSPGPDVAVWNYWQACTNSEAYNHLKPDWHMELIIDMIQNRMAAWCIVNWIEHWCGMPICQTQSRSGAERWLRLSRTGNCLQCRGPQLPRNGRPGQWSGFGLQHQRNMRDNIPFRVTIITAVHGDELSVPESECSPMGKATGGSYTSVGLHQNTKS